MDTNQYQLLSELLKRKTYTKASTLSKILGVSTRSIHTYVHEINELVKDDLILSSNRGYFLSSYLYKKYEDQLIVGIPQDNQSRAIHLIKNILQSPSLSIDAFDFLEEIHVGSSTLQNVVSQAREFLQEKNIEIKSVKNRLEIVGNHDQIRILKKEMILNEASQNQITLGVLNEVFGEEITNKVLTFIHEYIDFLNIKIYDFSLLSIALHLSIILTTIIETKEFHSHKVKKYSNVELFVYQSIKEEFKISLALEDVQLIINTINAFSDYNETVSSHNELIDSSKLIDEIIILVDEYYDISLNNTEFISAFKKHIDNLAQRIHQSKKVHNPIIDHIKDSTPYIYDIATNVGMYINRFFDKSVMSEDEVGFIALHLGAEIQRQNKKKNLIQTLLIVPDYIEKKTNLTNTISKEFSDTLYIVDISTNENYADFESCDYELVISTLTHVVNSDCKDYTVKISPFYTNEDRIKLLEKIDSIQLQKSNRLLKNLFDNFFTEGLFFVVEEQENSYQDKYFLIDEMSSVLEKNQYVNAGYSKLISERESLGSTKFNKIAVPHQTLVAANKTGVCTYFFPEGFKWDNEYVFFVFMIAITRKDREKFQKIYESLLYTFEESEIFTHLEAITDFKSFKYHILNLLTS